MPAFCSRIGRRSSNFPNLYYTTTPRVCPRPWLQRQPNRPISASTWSTQKVRDEGPLYRSRTQVTGQQEPKDLAKPQKDQDTESIKPESFERKQEAGSNPKDSSIGAGDVQEKNREQQNDPLLAEQTVSNKEQRKADWAIIKEMSKYLWPKDNLGTKFRVGASVGLLIGAKVCFHCHSTYSFFNGLPYAH